MIVFHTVSDYNKIQTKRDKEAGMRGGLWHEIPGSAVYGMRICRQEDGMYLHNSFINEFGQVEGAAFFPYFNKDITVICRKGVSPEYAEKCLAYLEEVDDALMLQICKYAEMYLKDMLENTSIGDLEDGEEAFPYDGLLDLLKYISFEILYIEEPPESIKGASEIKALNLTGGCDWQEDEGLQCLVRDGEVVYMGYFDDLSVWGDYSQMYIGNYVLWETYRKRLLEYKKNMVVKPDSGQMRTQSFYDHWNEKGSLVRSKVTDLINHIAAAESVSFGEAVVILEGTFFYQLMNEYPQILEEDTAFWYQCYRVEKETDEGELMRYVCENCEWDLF